MRTHYRPIKHINMKKYSLIKGLNRFHLSKLFPSLEVQIHIITPPEFERGYVNPPKRTLLPAHTSTPDTDTMETTPTAIEVILHPPYTRYHYQCSEEKYELYLPFFPTGNLYNQSGALIKHGSKEWIKQVSKKYAAHKKQLQQAYQQKQEAEALYNGSNYYYYCLREHYISDANDYCTDFHKFFSIQQSHGDLTILPSIDFIPSSAQLEHLTGFHGDPRFKITKERLLGDLKGLQIRFRQLFLDHHEYILLDVHHRPLKRRLDNTDEPDIILTKRPANQHFITNVTSDSRTIH